MSGKAARPARPTRPGYRCVECGWVTGKWVGRCGECQAWGSVSEVGAATADTCQVQGVWVDPALRGKGLGTAGTAAVVELARRRVAPVVSLYVNDFNAAARRSYARVGFVEQGVFTSVLF